MSFVGGHWWLIIIVLVIVLIVWGPGKLPDVGAGMGRALREFRKASSETRETFMNATSEQQTPPAPPPPPVAAPPPPPPQTPVSS
ncbi:MAG TPA: twin-arginine translocase TatA/TatE family subunit [Candidatus Acidoferrales bacterium]|jgi:sec-independent protein translocase protein TatA|nr:twin-arginine translocase TatA/TatE family subunit [Candidatus Acidoferrales bacterium]